MKQYSFSSFKSKKLLKIWEDKVLFLLKIYVSMLFILFVKLFLHKASCYLKKTISNVAKYFFVTVSSLASGIKEMGHGELTTTSSCSSFMPLCLQRNKLDITLEVFRTGVDIYFFPGCQT